MKFIITAKKLYTTKAATIIQRSEVTGMSVSRFKMRIIIHISSFLFSKNNPTLRTIILVTTFGNKNMLTGINSYCRSFMLRSRRQFSSRKPHHSDKHYAAIGMFRVL